jgi:hypothetical protein
MKPKTAEGNIVYQSRFTRRQCAQIIDVLLSTSELKHIEKKTAQLSHPMGCCKNSIYHVCKACMKGHNREV